MKITREIFIERAKNIFNDIYNYDQIDYVDYNTEIKLNCQEHGDFEIKPVRHITVKQHCNKCALKKQHDGFRLSRETVIEEFRKKHGDTYNYDKVVYVNTHKPVIIICKIHGEFKTSPSDHKRGRNCIQCARIIKNKAQQYTTEIFIKKAIEIHKNKYLYDKVNYINTNTLVTIICQTHGDFQIKPNNFLQKKGCQKCSNRYFTPNNSIEEKTKIFIERAKEIHGDKYIYDKTIYTKSSDKVIIICKDHGEFKIKADNIHRIKVV